MFYSCHCLRRQHTRLSADERESGEKQTVLAPIAPETRAPALRLNQSALQCNMSQMQTADLNAVSSVRGDSFFSASGTSSG